MSTDKTEFFTEGEPATENRRMLEALGEPFPDVAIRQRVGGGGRRFEYVETHTVIHRLNKVCPYWSWEINRFESHGELYIVVGTLSIPGLGVRSGIGVQVVTGKAGEDLVKGASSDALKKAATLFGVALDLYGPDYEEEAELRAVAKPKPAPPHTPKTSSVGKAYAGKSADEIAKEHTAKPSPFDEEEETREAEEMKERMEGWRKFRQALATHELATTNDAAVAIYNRIVTESKKPGYKPTPKHYEYAAEFVEKYHDKVKESLETGKDVRGIATEPVDPEHEEVIVLPEKVDMEGIESPFSEENEEEEEGKTEAEASSVAPSYEMSDEDVRQIHWYGLVSACREHLGTDDRDLINALVKRLIKVEDPDYLSAEDFETAKEVIIAQPSVAKDTMLVVKGVMTENEEKAKATATFRKVLADRGLPTDNASLRKFFKKAIGKSRADNAAQILQAASMYQKRGK